jgi:non-heme chloroperoxidase
MDTYADDLAALTEALDIKDAIHVGHSTGGGEVARYIGRHGSKRVAKAVLIGAVPPINAQNSFESRRLAHGSIRPDSRGRPGRSFAILEGSQCSVLGANRAGARVSEGLRDSFWLQGVLAGHKAVYDCIKAFPETDFTEDLKKMDVPTLILHGDDDQIVPITDSAYLSAKLVKNATPKVVPGAPHAMWSTHKDLINVELLAFFQRRLEATA